MAFRIAMLFVAIPTAFAVAARAQPPDVMPSIDAHSVPALCQDAASRVSADEAGRASSATAGRTRSRVRCLTPVATRLLQDGLEGSPTFRTLFDQVAVTDLIVVVVTGRWEPEEGHCHANLRFVGGGGDARLVRILD